MVALTMTEGAMHRVQCVKPKWVDQTSWQSALFYYLRLHELVDGDEESTENLDWLYRIDT